MIHDRPDPDELLARVQLDEVKQSRGKLKIFFGMAPGVGKTFAMLEDARKIAKEGVDVVIGYVEPHARPETQALVIGLDLLARRKVSYSGKDLFEFDLEAALKRHPQLILVDELAHTNALGMTHSKRWQDVEDLLSAGIDVYTTLNVQHIESLNDIVTQVTMIPVRETVPDKVFEAADEVELVDLPPDDLIERLKDGKVYMPQQAYRALENFFRKGNLIALRELSLRKTAERVGEQALDYRQQNEVTRIWPTSDRLLVCVGASPMSARLVRATRRMAGRLRAPWIALNVQLDQALAQNSTGIHRLEQNLRLAEELGGTVETASGSEFAETVLHFAREKNVTKIIIGKPLRSRWSEFWRGSLVYDLIRKCGDIDVYVISGDGDQLPVLPSSSVNTPIHPLPYFWATCAVLGATALGSLLAPLFAPTNLVMVYLACIVFVSLAWGRGPSIMATLLGVLAFDLFFVPPYGTFAIEDTQYVFTFVVMLLTGLTISELTARVRLQTEVSRERERRTAALYGLSREIGTLPTRDAVALAASRIIRHALDVDVWIYIRSPDGSLVPIEHANGVEPPSKDWGVVQWVFEHGRAAGKGTDTLPGTDTTFFPLQVAESIIGVLGVRPLHGRMQIGSQQLYLLRALVGLVAGALERCALTQQSETTRLQIEKERMRNSLLSSVSHDLRTPLATITGAASTLLQKDSKLKEQDRQELAESIVDEADRLHRLVTNLLDLTRLEVHAIQIQRELQPIEEVIGVVLLSLDRQVRKYKVETHLATDLPPVPIDALLVQQLLINLLDNALKFGVGDAPIELTVTASEQDLIVSVADRGPGIPPEQLQQIFDKFYRVYGMSQTGSGLGLAICKAIVELHGGTIAAENRSGGGAVFRFTLPLHPEYNRPLTIGKGVCPASTNERRRV